MSGVLFGFAPWIVYWVLSGFGEWTAAVLAGLATSLALVVYRLRTRNIKTMEAVTLGYFAVNAVVSFGLGLPVFQTYGALSVNLTLAAMAFGSLMAKSPFTYEYARESYPREYWNNPLFRRVNEMITAVWGGIFTFNTVLALIALAAPNHSLGLNAIVANVAVGAGVVFSSRFPDWYTRRRIAREIAGRDPWESPKFETKHPAAANEHDVIVVGSGIGGLSAAALLAQQGLKVAVFEQHFLAGGFCTSWERGVRRGSERWRYVFDAGVHDVSGLGPRGGTRNLLKRLDVEDQIEWRRMPHEYFLPDVHVRIPERAEDFIKLLGDLHPAERENIVTYFKEMQFVYREMYADIEKTNGAPTAPRTVEDTLAYPKLHPHFYRWGREPFDKMLDTYFHNEQLKILLKRLGGYLTDDPSKLTVEKMAPMFGYYFDGGYYPVGGSQVIADTLVQVIEENGGKVYLRTPVKRILLEGNRAVGVELGNGAVHCAQAIISNADARKTFLELVGREHLSESLAARLDAMKFSTSAIYAFLGVDFVPDIEPVVIIRTEQEKLGIMTPSKVDPSIAPRGHSAITLIKYIPSDQAAAWDRRAPGYIERKHRYANQMIALAEQVIPDLSKHIVYRQEATPATVARYAWSTEGAIYGPAVGEGFQEPKSPVERLYLVGSSASHVGIEGVAISGMLTADAVYHNQAKALSPATSMTKGTDTTALAGARQLRPRLS